MRATISRKIFLNIALIVTGFIFICAALEGALRLLNLKAPGYVTLDLYANYGQLYKPNAKGRWYGRAGFLMEFDNVITMNSQSLHDTEHTFEKPPDIYRILYLGDSFVEAVQVPIQDTFFKIAEKEINKSPLSFLKGRRVECIAIGRHGNGSIAELEDLTTRGSLYKPDLVVVFVLTGNDFSDDLFYFDKHSPAEQSAENGLFADKKNYPYFDLYEHMLIFKDSYLNRWIAFLVTEKLRLPYLIRTFGAILKRDLGIYATPDTRIFKDQLPVWEKAFLFTSSNYLKMESFCRQRNIKFLVVLVDTEFSYKTQKRRTLYKVFPELKSEKLDFDKPSKKLKKVFGDMDIDYLDLNPAFEENYKKNGPPTHFEHDGHWTKEGHKLAARVLMEHLK